MQATVTQYRYVLLYRSLAPYSKRIAVCPKVYQFIEPNKQSLELQYVYAYCKKKIATFLRSAFNNKPGECH